MQSAETKERNGEFDLDNQTRNDLSKKGMVLAISETAFPHQYNFMLLEPCSHTFWAYTHTDCKLNHMEKRADKQCYANILQESITGGILRDATNQKMERISQPGYQLSENESTKKERIDLLVTKKSLEHELASGKSDEVKLVYGKTIETHPKLFRDIKVFFNH